MRFSILKSSHGIRAVKTFSDEGVESYPRISRFNSEDFQLPNTIEGFREKMELCRRAASEGACMVKGYLTKPLCNESRAGKVNKDALTDNLILDIDGILLENTTITTPIDQAQLKVLAEKVVMHLPRSFHSASYIVHASSSMGMKGDKVCLHLEYLLQEPTTPGALKDYVLYLNHEIELFERNISLSASGTALRYPLDRTVVDNSHIIYIAQPEFKGSLQDPIPQTEDRIFLVEKQGATVDLEREIREHSDPAKNVQRNHKKVNDLRVLEGLPKRNEKTTQMKVDGHALYVVTNPDSCKMTFAADNGDFVAYNVNGGDSAGYYVLKYNPTVVRNFKGEPNFLFELADPQTYQWHLETFIGTAAPVRTENGEVKPAPQLPLVFRDEASNAYYNALLDTGTARISRIAKASREGLPDWMAQYEGVMPENIPIWNYQFDPHRKEIVSFRERFINKYLPSPLMSQTEVPADFIPLGYETAHMLHHDCPKIAELILHITGGNVPLYNHFINWFAAALQSRDKIGTAWILQGTQGTGKGVFYEHVLCPLVGTGVNQEQPYCTKIRLENIEEQYNQWEECSLFTVLDEFRLGDSQRAQKLFNKIKSMITETHVPIRGMRENMRTVRTYTNFLFFSNDQDVMYLPEDDRRFNIGDRQEVKLNQVWPSEAYVIEELIPLELPRFALHMQHFHVNHVQARTVMETAAKIEMREVSRTTIEDFVHAIRTGDLEYFLPILDIEIGVSKTGSLINAQNKLKEVLMRIKPDGSCDIAVDELRLFYCELVQQSENANKFGKLMSKYGLVSKKIRINKSTPRGFQTNWAVSESRLQELVQIHTRDNIIDFDKGTRNCTFDSIKAK